MRHTSSLALALALVSAAGAASSASACPKAYQQTRYAAPTSHVVHYAPAATPAPTVVPPIAAPTMVALAKPQLTTGATVTADANFLGADAGQVLLHLGSVTIACEVVEWQASAVTFKLPNLGLRESIAASIQLLRPDGQQVRRFEVALQARPTLVEHVELQQAVTAASQPAPAEISR